MMVDKADLVRSPERAMVVVPPAAPAGPRQRRTGGRKARTAREALFDASEVLAMTAEAALLAFPTARAASKPPSKLRRAREAAPVAPAAAAEGSDDRPAGLALSVLLTGALGVVAGAAESPAKEEAVILPPVVVVVVDAEEAPEQNPMVGPPPATAKGGGAPVAAAAASSSSDLNDDALERFGIRTGEDAINFFSSQSGSASSIKFVHLMQVDEAPASVVADPSVLRRADQGPHEATFRPYDLVAVRGLAGSAYARACRLPYYTMSAEGLVVTSAGCASEFIPLTQWMRESACFNMLTSIHFFRNYLRNKCFNAWRSNVSFLQFSRQRRHLKDRLFVAMPSFCEPFLELRRHMHDMQQIKLLELGNRTFECPVFVDRQSAARAEAAKQLDASLDAAASSVYAVCKDIAAVAHPAAEATSTAGIAAAMKRTTQAANKPNDGTNSSSSSKKNKKKAAAAKMEEDADLVSRVIAQMEELEKPRSMSALKDREVRRKQALRRAVHEYRLLPDFIRLADYVAIEALAKLLISTWTAFLAELLRPRRQSGLLETTIRFSDDGSTFLPTCSAIQAVLANTAESLVTMVGGVMRILHLRPLRKYLRHHHLRPAATSAAPSGAAGTAEASSSSIVVVGTMATATATAGGSSSSSSSSHSHGAAHGGGRSSSSSSTTTTTTKASLSAPNVPEIVRNAAEFRATALAINSKIEADFRKAQEYVAVAFDKVWPIYEYSRRWDFEAYKRQAHTVASLKKEMEKVAGWEKEMEKMRTRQTCGMLEVESRKLRQMLIPMTNEKMGALKDLVKDLSRAKCKDQRNKYKAAITKIAPRPAHLAGFTVLLERVEEQRVQAKSLFKHTQIVEQMYQMLNHYDARIGDQDLVQLDELRAIQAKYNEDLDASQRFRDERLGDMLGQLDRTVGNFDEQVQALAADLERGAFVDILKMSTPASVLNDLEVVRGKLAAFAQQDAAHRKQHNLFASAKLAAAGGAGAHATPAQGSGLTAADASPSSPKSSKNNPQAAAAAALGDPTTKKNKDHSKRVSVRAGKATAQQPTTSSARRSKALTEAQEAYERTKTLWTMVERWGEDFSTWTHDEFGSQDVAAIERDVGLYHRGATALAKKVHNPVILRLVEQTATLRDKMPIIRTLADPALTLDHWALIFHHLGQPPPQDKSFTLDQLIHAGVLHQNDFLDDVLHKAKNNGQAAPANTNPAAAAAAAAAAPPPPPPSEATTVIKHLLDDLLDQVVERKEARPS